MTAVAAIVWLVLLGAALIANGVGASRRSMRWRVAVAVSAGVLALLASILLHQWHLPGERRMVLARKLDGVRSEVRRLEVTASRLGDFKQEADAREARLRVVRGLVPVQIDMAAVEAQLRGVARAVGLRIADISATSSPKARHTEATLTLSVEGSPDAAKRFATRVAELSRLYHVDDIFLPRAQGTMRLRAFAVAASPEPSPRDECVDPPADPYPSWLLSLEAERERLREACVHRAQLEPLRRLVTAFESEKRLLNTMHALVAQTRGLPPVRVRTEFGLTVAQFRLSALDTGGQTPVAIVRGPSGKTLDLRAGHRLADGVVKSVLNDHVIVEAERATGEGKPLERRLLRFTMPQPLPSITLGHDTTRITSPLLSDGTPDYGAWLNQTYGAGLEHDDNAAIPLNAAFTGFVDTGQSFWDGIPLEGRWARLHRPWSEEDCLECARRLRLNEKPLGAVAKAVLRPRYFVPGTSGSRFSQDSIPSMLHFRVAADALKGRGMLRLGRGDLKGATEDALTGQRLALALGQGPALIDRLIATAVRSIGTPLLPAIACTPSFASVDARRLLRELQALPEMGNFAETLERKVRFEALDQVLLLRERAAERGGGGMLEILEPTGLGALSEPPPPVIYLLPASAFDWDEALRLVNRGHDLLVAAKQAGTEVERRRARAALDADAESGRKQADAVLQKVGKPTRRDETALAEMAAAGAELGQTPKERKQLARFLVTPEASLRSLLLASISWNEAEALFRLAATVVGLSVHRLETGSLPVSLDALARLLPGRLAVASALPGYVLRYQPGPPGSSAGPGSGVYALTAVPEEANVTGVRGFCVDSTGGMRFTADASAPKMVAGLCDPGLPVVR